MRTRTTIIMTAAIILLAAGCRHQPVYPTYGELYVSSSPSGAEVILDGTSTKRSTPVRLTGVAEGGHQLTVRYYGYRVARQDVTIQGGMSTRAAIKMEMITPSVAAVFDTYTLACHMAFEPTTQRAYIANSTHYIDVVQVAGATLSRVGSITVQTGNLSNPGTKLVGVSLSAGRLYAVLKRDTIISVDLATQAVRKRFKPADSTNFIQLRLSGDGRTAYLADSLNRRIWKVDVAADSVTGYMALTGVPSDFLVDPHTGHLYVTLSNIKRVVELDQSGAVLRSATTGNSPGGLFHNDAWDQLAFCNRTDKRNTVIDPATWSTANGPIMIDPTILMTCGAFGHDGTHLWTNTTSLPYPTPDGWNCDPGYLHLIYLPTMQYVTHFLVGKQPAAMESTPDGRYLLVLNRFDHQLLLYRTQTE